MDVTNTLLNYRLKSAKLLIVLFSVYGHEGVIKLVDWYECLDSFILIMERPENSVDLFDYIRESGRLKEQQAKNIFRQVDCHSHSHKEFHSLDGIMIRDGSKKGTECVFIRFRIFQSERFLVHLCS